MEEVMRMVWACLALFFSPLLSANTLFQIVSLDCGYCAEFQADDGVSEVTSFATRQGLTFRVGALGPFNQSGARPIPEPEVMLFYSAAKLSPGSSPQIADVFYRYYSEIKKTGVHPGKDALIDHLAITANVPPERLSDYLSSDLREHFRSWRRTAAILKSGMEFSGKSEYSTPAFVVVKKGKVIGYTEWTGDSKSTISAVESMVRRTANED